MSQITEDVLRQWKQYHRKERKKKIEKKEM